MKWLYSIGVVCLLVFISGAGLKTYAQIDSRNQAKPVKEQSNQDPDKKKQKKKRIKSKKNPRDKGKKIYSNKKQLRNNRRAKAKEVDKKYKGDITGRKIVEPDRKDREQRTYPQPDPYQNRRIRTERSRAGPDAPNVRSITKRGERARLGDISGQRKVRQRSVSSAPKRTYAQPNPYVGRKIRTEKDRVVSNKKIIRNIRSATRPAESRKPQTRTPPLSATAAPRTKVKRHVYRSHQRIGGEKSTNRDIAGRKIRTKNTRSAVQLSGLGMSATNPYWGRKPLKEGQRFKRSSALPASARSISRSAESGSSRTYDRYGQHRNRKSVRFSGVVAAKRIRTTSNPARKGETRVFGNKRYQPGPVRSASGYSYAGRKSAIKAPISASGSRKQYRQRNTYLGKDRHFGENYTSRDIAGKKLRTRNKRSAGATWADFGGGTFGLGSAYKPPGKYKSAAGRTQTKAGWNNNGQPLKRKAAAPSSWFAARHRGDMPLSKMPGIGPSGSQYSGNVKSRKLRYGPGPESRYAGRTPMKSITGFGSSGSQYTGNVKSRKLRYGPGPESRYAGRTPMKSITGFGSSGSQYTGNVKSRKLRYGPGPESRYAGRTPMKAVTGFRSSGSQYTGNVKSRKLRYGPGPESRFAGRTPMKSVTGFGASGSQYAGNIPSRKVKRYRGGNESLYAGNHRARKPLSGGGSITAFWNNKGQPLVGKRGPDLSSGYTGRLPLSALPSYDGSREGRYQGNMKARKPLKGGGSITKRWNNKNQPIEGKGPGKYDVGRYTGSLPLYALPSYYGSREGSYPGNIKAKKPIKGAGGSITKRWNNKNQPIEGKGPGKYGVASYQGVMKAKKPLKGAGGSLTMQWNNKNQPIEGKGPGKYDVGRYSGNLPLSALPSYDGRKEGSYAGNMKAKKPLKGGGGSITRHWNNKEQPLEGKGPGKYDVGQYQGSMPLSAIPGYSNGKEGKYQGTMKPKGKAKQSPGTERGRTRSLTFLRIGNPQHMGLSYEEQNLAYKKDLPDELTRKEKQRIADADGLDRGRTRSLSFMKIGDPTHGGLRAVANNMKRKSDLPDDIRGKNRLRLKESGGLDNGRNRSFSFWAIGDPTHGGLVRNPAQAKGRLHPSSNYTASGKSKNAVEEKEQPIKIKIWWAKLFKKNSNQPDAVKEKVRRPRYDKNERSIWETAERPDWYNKQ